MKLDTTGHVRVTPLTDCGCLRAGEPTLSTDVPVYLTEEPVIVDDVFTAYTIDLSINGAGPATMPAHAMVETWIRASGAACDDGTSKWASITLRHLVDGETAQPWSPCVEHGGIEGDTGPAITIIATWMSSTDDFPGLTL